MLDGQPSLVQEMRIGKLTDEQRVTELRSCSYLESIPCPGIPEIKQIELMVKWRKVVPQHLWKFTCPTVAPEILERHKNNKREKAKIACEKKKLRLLEINAPCSREKKKPPKATTKSKKKKTTGNKSSKKRAAESLVSEISPPKRQQTQSKEQTTNNNPFVGTENDTKVPDNSSVTAFL